MRLCCLFLLLVALPQAGTAQAGVAGPQPFAVQPIPLNKPAASALSARKTLYTLSVPGNGAWIDTGVVLSPAAHLEITATGSLTLTDQRRTGPAGVASGWKDLLRRFPAEDANTGALVGRIGGEEAVPFAIGEAFSRDVVASGELVLAANVADTLAGSGRYAVTLRLSPATLTALESPPVELRQLITPALLAAMPRRVTDASGSQGDVVNFALVGTQAQVERAFTAAGWVSVDKSNDEAVLHGLLATLSKKAYLEMPMSMLFLFGRPQDLSYARADPLVVAMVRHHLRVWSAGQTVAGRPLWVGSATHDNGLERDQRDNGLTHHIDPQIDTERDFFEGSFAAAGVLSAAAYATPLDPVRSAQTATGGSFETDGRVLVMVLRAQ